ncbi:hypothetical protein [Nocardia brevicatena]|uniref:hypothetical protein n=1 Tax=Nocardia brevicatena TaxID=37327 RepID=UPI00030266B1|nr:hypothetical protein [Nocardia brevicatena]
MGNRNEDQAHRRSAVLSIGAVLGFFLGGVGALVTVPSGTGTGALIGYSTP